jgi:antirestriction protein ArdC
MAAAIEALRENVGWRRWLALRHRFHTYSLKNQLLIAHQRPGATRVASFKRWLSLGYCVRKGERAIRIWKYCEPSKKKIERWRREGADPEKRPEGYFILVPVFDRSQVDPLADFEGERVDLDPPMAPVSGDSLAHLIEPLCEFATTISCKVSFGPIAAPASCSYHQASGAIVVGCDTPNGRVKALLNRLALALLRQEAEEGDPQITYFEEESVVECVAFTVCSTVGFDTSGFSVPYVASWGEGGEIERYAALINRLASRLEDAVLAADLDQGPTDPEPLALAA